MGREGQTGYFVWYLEGLVRPLPSLTLVSLSEMFVRVQKGRQDLNKSKAIGRVVIRKETISSLELSGVSRLATDNQNCYNVGQ